MSLMNYKVTNQLVMAASQLSIIVKQADMVFFIFFHITIIYFLLEKGRVFRTSKKFASRHNIRYNSFFITIRSDYLDERYYI